MEAYSDDSIEKIESEEKDSESIPSKYEIITYPADYTLEGLVLKFNKKQLRVPGFQRKFVWSINQASRLIESFLIGLPVPAIFLYSDPDDGVLNVIDGQQRLLSIVYYFEGYFGEDNQGKRTVFALKGLNEKSLFYDKKYKALLEKDRAILNDAVLRAFIVKQLDPSDSTSIYHIFERLNTGGTQLVGQEVRNCIFHGKFNDLLKNLNIDENWRKIFGSPLPDKRQRDIELILRFFALNSNFTKYEKPMKDFLSDFMKKYKNPENKVLDSFAGIFKQICNKTIESLGEKPFHIKKGLNAAVFDSVFISIAENLDKVLNKKRYDSLIKNESYLDNVTSSTTDKEVLTKRIESAKNLLFGL